MHYGKTEKLDLTLIQIFLFMSPFLFGLFYEFRSFIAEIFISAKNRKSKRHEKVNHAEPGKKNVEKTE